MVRGVQLVTVNPLVQRLADLHRLVKTIKDAEAARKDIQYEVVQEFKRETMKTKSYVEDGFRIKATLVATERVTIDEEKLKKSLGSDLWEKVSTRKLDKGKLESLIGEGKVDPVVVAACSETKESPYIKFTESKAIDDEEEE